LPRPARAHAQLLHNTVDAVTDIGRKRLVKNFSNEENGRALAGAINALTR